MVAIHDGEIEERKLSTTLDQEAAHCVVAVHLETIAVDHHPCEAADGDKHCESDSGRQLNLSVGAKRVV